MDRLTTRARTDGVPLARLQKQVAFERFLARLFHGGNRRWVLKGGYALELRLGGRARATSDLDLGVPPPPEEELVEELQEAAEVDLGDFFEFRVSRPNRGAELRGPPEGGYRFKVEVRLAGRGFGSFPLDVGQGDELVGPPERVTGQVDLTFANLEPVTLPVYPLEDHFAEKLHAYSKPRESRTRVKDLVDLLLLIDLGLHPTPLLRQGVNATFERYNTHPVPEALPEPPRDWESPFAQLAEEVALSERKIAGAFEVVQAFYDRLFPRRE